MGSTPVAATKVYYLFLMCYNKYYPENNLKINALASGFLDIGLLNLLSVGSIPPGGAIL